MAEDMGFSHQSSRGARYGEAFRDHYRLGVHSEYICQQVWDKTGLKEAMVKTWQEMALNPQQTPPQQRRGQQKDELIQSKPQQAVGLNPNIRMYKYSIGERFGKHIDDCCYVPELHGYTKYTLLVYLSSTAGGDTVFYDDKDRVVASVQPQTGLALLHRHGEKECLEHEATAVMRGVKYVLRSDVVFR